MWDPVSYRRYGDERSRPFHDLLGRVGAERPRAVVDLGCGPGTLTATLAQRWPGARVTGLDSSPEMVAQARNLAAPVAFQLADLRAFQPGPDVDVLLSNAALQWVPDHGRLLSNWARQLPAGAWLALQVPGNFTAHSHRTLRELAGEPPWRPVLAGVLRDNPVDDAAGYARRLIDAGCAVDAWETTYLHLLPVTDDAEHPVLRWMDGTALRPVRAALADDPAGWAAFRRELGQRLAAGYPARGGLVPFPFRRIFVVARTGARPPRDPNGAP